MLFGSGTSSLSIPRSKSDRHRVDWPDASTVGDIIPECTLMDCVSRCFLDQGVRGSCLELAHPVATGGRNFKATSLPTWAPRAGRLDTQLAHANRDVLVLHRERT